MSQLLAAALVAFQKAAPPIKLDATNPHFKNRYVSLDGFMDAVRPVLTENGLVLSQFPTIHDGHPALRTRLTHVSGEFMEDTMLLLVDRENPQGQGSALTYARRYSAMAVLGLVGDEDDDGQTASRTTTSRQSSTPNEARPSQGGPTPQNAEEFRFPSGKHQGKTMAEAPRSYMEWCVAEHPKPEVRELAAVFLGFEAAAVGAEPNSDDEIPF